MSDAPTKVKMKFTENKFYNDMNKPMFHAGEVYEMEGVEWIQRWLRRGGIIVEGKLPETPAVPDPSSVVLAGEKTPVITKPTPVVEDSTDDEEPEEEEETKPAPKGKGKGKSKS